MANVSRTFLGNDTRIELDDNERDALLSMIERYTDGHGMPVDDEDEPFFDTLYNLVLNN